MSSLFSHILVPVDFTEKNNAALRTAKQLAHQNQARVTLLHVIETIEYVVDEEVADFYDKLKATSKTKLQFLADLFTAENINVQYKIVVGKRARGIVSFAMQNKVDLVVLSSHKVELSEVPKGLGTLSHHVSLLCQCPVLLVR